MRSPSTKAVGASFSTHFRRRSGTPPDRLVEGLRMSRSFAHEPVMVEEVVALLAPVPPGLFVDATIGKAGHARAVLGAHPHLSLLGVDRDPAAVEAARAELADFLDRVEIRLGTFDRLGAILARRAPSAFLFDLGVSSPQLDRPERGFSYRREGPLDMRMGPDGGRTAADLVNGASVEELARLFAEHGERRFARRIAKEISAARPLATTTELAQVVERSIPRGGRRRGHPARRVFQALRAAVNDEAAQLAAGLDVALATVAPQGRCVVISYHSGEDRAVKERFLDAATGSCNCPSGLPCVCGARPGFRLLTRGARKPSAAEVEANPRSESARLRAVQRLAPDGTERLVPPDTARDATGPGSTPPDGTPRGGTA